MTSYLTVSNKLWSVTYTINKAVTKGTKNKLNGIHFIIIEGDNEFIIVTADTSIKETSMKKIKIMEILL